jgi:putative phosphoesterase
VIELEFLGTGTSTGVPVIGCDCVVCRSGDPLDTRLRASVLIRVDDVTLLVDTSPDLRYQMLRSGTRHIDGVLFTHTHADHTAGMDEIRRFNAMQRARIPAWAPENAAADLRERFGYAFREEFPVFGMAPDLDLHVIRDTAPFDVAGVTVQPVPIMHGRLPVLGYRVGNLAYLTDVKTIPEASRDLLQDLDVLVLTALRRDQHPAHMTLEEALAAIDELKPRRACLSHIGHDMGLHADVQAGLPENVHLAYDGMRVGGLDRIAVVSDVHGNMTAYDAVLADIDARGIQRVINLGDVIGKGPCGSAAIARTRERCEATVRGNWDEFIDSKELGPNTALKWWYDDLAEEDRSWLRALPFSIDLQISGRMVRLFHASADSVFHRVRAQHTDAEFNRMFRNTEATGSGQEPSVVVYGDIHAAYAEEQGNRTLINAGSVGNPLDQPTASYVILEGVTDGVKAGPFRYEIVRVPYDIEAEISIASERGMLELDEYAVELRSAVYRGLQSSKVARSGPD